MPSRLYRYTGGESGQWRIVSQRPVAGTDLPSAARLHVASGNTVAPRAGSWTLRGMVSNQRYTTREEQDSLAMKQPGLGRVNASCAALIPIRKSEAWWRLAQDERRRIFEDASAHVQTGLRYLPAIARRLHHCRDLGEDEPFDFLTWFEYAPADETLFDGLVAALRATEEWRYVEREIDIRLVRESF